MGHATQEETTRNEAIYNDFKAGLSYIEMVHKYQLSSQRLWQIVKREENRERLQDAMPNLDAEKIT